MPEGTVKFFNRAKGFGFIVPDDGDKEIFLPPAAVTGVALSPGQRVSFEVVADPKGPKAASLKVLEGVVAPKPPAAPRPQPAPAQAPAATSLYCDPSAPNAQAVLAALQALGQHPQVIDIAVAPPTALQLRKWSQALAEKGQGLVRRTMPLFFDLQLDDRFLHEDEFWTAVVQHPALINSPILTVRDRVRICKTAADVKAFFTGADVDPAPQSKNISSRLMAMMRGEAVGPRPQPEPEDADDIEDADEADDIDDVEEAEEAPAPAAVKAVAKPKSVKTADAPVAAKVAKAKPAAKAAKPAAKKPVAKKAAPAGKKPK